MIDLSKCKGIVVELDSREFEKLLDVFVPSIDIRLRPSKLTTDSWNRLLSEARRVVEAEPSDEPIEKWAARLAEDISELTD